MARKRRSRLRFLLLLVAAAAIAIWWRRQQRLDQQDPQTNRAQSPMGPERMQAASDKGAEQAVVAPATPAKPTAAKPVAPKPAAAKKQGSSTTATKPTAVKKPSSTAKQPQSPTNGAVTSRKPKIQGGST